LIPRPVPVQLAPDEVLIAEKFFAVCDARAEGFRLGMEQAKKMFAQYLISQRHKQEKKDNA